MQKTMKEGCYFEVDTSVPAEERTMSVYCVECYDKYKGRSGWFWDGANRGYGPFDYICDDCGKVIHRGPGETNER